jgi:hypothetical protein
MANPFDEFDEAEAPQAQANPFDEFDEDKQQAAQE